MAWTTGRTRTATCTGSLGGHLYLSIAGTSVTWQSMPFFQLEVFGCYIKGYWDENYSYSGGSGTLRPNWTVECGTIGLVGGAKTRTPSTPWDGVNRNGARDEQTFHPSGGPPTLWLRSIAGSYTVSVDVEECVEISELPYATDGTEDNPDIPQPAQFTLFERMRVGGTISVSVTSGGATCSCTRTITSANTLGYFGQIYIETRLSTLWTTDFETNTVSMSVLFNGLAANAAYTRAGTRAYVDANVCSVRATSQNGQWRNCALDGLLFPDRAFALNVIARAMEDTYPDYLEMLVYDKHGSSGVVTGISGGLGSFSGSQRQANLGSIMNAPDSNAPFSSPPTLPVVNTESYVIEEYAPVYANLRASQLLALSEDVEDKRLLLRGFFWDSFTLSQAASSTVDNCGATTDWSAGANTTLSDVGSALQAVIAGGTGSLTRSFSPAVSLASYRYLRIRVRSVGAADQDVRVTIGSKRWDMTTGADGSWVERDLDLCQPTNTVATTDTTDSRWPVPTVDGPMWGVTEITSLVLEELADGVTYEIDDLSLVRASGGYSRVSFASAYKAWVKAKPDTIIGATTTETKVRRFLLGDTDGRQSLEEADVTWDRVTSDLVTFDIHTSHTLESLIAFVNAMDSGVTRNPGWSATDLAPSGDFQNNTRYACYAEGGGARWTGSEWVYGFDLDASGSLTVVAQTLCEAVSWYPDAGDCWYGGSYGPVLDIRAAILLRGQGHGLVFNETYEPNPTVTVTAKDGAADAGSGVTGTDGAYQTGLPYGKGQRSITLTAQAGDPQPSAGHLFSSRKRHRACFRAGAAVNLVFRALEFCSERAWVHVGLEKRIQTYHAASMTLAFESEEHEVDSWLRLRWERRRPLLLCLGLILTDDPDTDDYRLYTSLDGGLSVGEVLTVTAKSAQIEADSERGVLSLLYSDEDDNVFVRFSRDGGDTWESAQEAMLWPEEEQLVGTLLDLSHDPRLAVMQLLLEVAEDDIRLYQSRDLGLTWELLLS